MELEGVRGLERCLLEFAGLELQRGNRGKEIGQGVMQTTWRKARLSENYIAIEGLSLTSVFLRLEWDRIGF